MCSCCPPKVVTYTCPPPCQPTISLGSSRGTICATPCCPPPCCPQPCCVPVGCNTNPCCPPNMLPPNITPLGPCYNPCCLPPGAVILPASAIPTLPGCM